MTTLELFKKHRKGEVSRERFLYEVRRDSNLPWVINTTSYDDAVKILKNKGIIREAEQFQPENITTDPIVDRVNPYALKRQIDKLLSKEKQLTNDSYKQALNNAAKKLNTPQAVKDTMFANADSIEKIDAKLQTQEIKKANHVDKHNGMKKIKGQHAPKKDSASTKENKKTKTPKGVEVMKDKGVEGSEKIIKEISDYLKKKLTLSEYNQFNEFHVGMSIPMEEGEGIVKEINGGTLCVEMPNGTMQDIQMGEAKRCIEQSKEPLNQEEGIDEKQQISKLEENAMLSIEERIELLEEAQDLINEAIDQIDQAVKGTSMQGSVNAYTIAHLSNWANGDNPYDMTIPKIIDELSEDEDEDLEDVRTRIREDEVEEDLQEAKVPSNVAEFAKRKGVSTIVNTVARWAEKVGKRVVGGTAVGKNYDTLILDLTHQGSEVYIDCNNETIKVNGTEVYDFKSFKSALGESDNEDIEELIKKNPKTGEAVSTSTPADDSLAAKMGYTQDVRNITIKPIGKI
jgi:hypothetical protein